MQPYCKEGSATRAYTTYVVDLKNCIVIVRNVPCEECENDERCVFSDTVMENLEEIVAAVQELSCEILVFDYK